MKTKEILAKIQRHLGSLKEEYNVERLGVFGSTVRGEQTSKSDVDILIDFSRPIGFFRFIQLEGLLSKILKKKVDLVSRKALKPAIRKNILDEVVFVRE